MRAPWRVSITPRGSGIGRSKHNCFSCSFPFVWSAHRNQQRLAAEVWGVWACRLPRFLYCFQWAGSLGVPPHPEILREVMGFSDKMSAPDAAGWPSVLPTAIAEKRRRISSRSPRGMPEPPAWQHTRTNIQAGYWQCLQLDNWKCLDLIILLHTCPFLHVFMKLSRFSNTQPVCAMSPFFQAEVWIQGRVPAKHCKQVIQRPKEKG